MEELAFDDPQLLKYTVHSYLHEKRWLQEVVASRNGSADRFIDDYLRTLDLRWLSFNGKKPMCMKERETMRKFVEGLRS